jgi:hypothetical protein
LWEFGLRPWDIAAGALIVAEAGGRVTNQDGSALGLDARKILTSNRKLHHATWRDDRKSLAGGASARSREPRLPVLRPFLQVDKSLAPAGRRRRG